MKYNLRILFLTVLFLALTACSKDIELTVENVENNTLVIREDDSLQVALVELFDKEYYDLEEFKSFISEEISNYNNKYGEASIVLDAIDKQEEKVVMILTYSNMEHYTLFNSVEGQLMGTNSATQGDITLPESFYTTKGESISAGQALEKDEYKVFAINENIRILVDGKIVYYYNGEYIDSQTLQSDNEEMTYLIYKDKLF